VGPVESTLMTKALKHFRRESVEKDDRKIANSVMFVHLSTWIISAPKRRILMKFDMCDSSKIYRENQILLKSNKNIGYFT